eukprot:11843057-Prorocentrum_lima.AAC.1
MSRLEELNLRDQDPNLQPLGMPRIMPWNTGHLELKSYPRHRNDLYNGVSACRKHPVFRP